MVFDIFTKELASSWQEPSVVEWMASARQLLKQYYLGFGGSQFDLYAEDEHGLLLAKICYVMFGVPTVSDAEELAEAYPEEQRAKAREILNRILEVHKEVRQERVLLVGIIVIACKQEECEFVLPLFSIYAGDDDAYEAADSSRIYVDTNRRTYYGFEDWKTNNALPMLKYAYPKRGYFTCSTQHCYVFDPKKEPEIEFGSSPQCTVMSRVLRGSDTVSIGATLGCGAIAVASIFTPIAPMVLLGSAMTGGSIGAYTAVRAAGRLIDKRNHGESLADLESLTLYFSILATPMHFTTSIVNAQLVQGASVNGRIFSQTTRMMATMLNFTTLGVDAALVCCGLANLVDKYRRKELSTLDVLNFSMSVFFFTNTLIKPKTAQAIIEHAQEQRIQQFADTMTDQEARATFDRFVAENGGKDGGSIADRSKIIRTINRISDGDSIFGKFHDAAEIRIGGRKGKTVLITDSTGEVTRLNPSKFSGVPQTKSNFTTLPANFRDIVRQKLPNNTEPEEYTLNGSVIFDRLSNWQMYRVAQMFESTGEEVIRAALHLAERLTQDDMLEKTLKGFAMINRVINLVEIIANEVHQYRQRNPNATTQLALTRVHENDFVDTLRREAEMAHRLAAESNLPFVDPVHALSAYREHGEDFTNRIWNPTVDPVEVYLRGAVEPPEVASGEACLVETDQLSTGETLEYYLLPNPDRYFVIIDQPEVAVASTESNAIQFEPDSLKECIDCLSSRVAEFTQFHFANAQTELAIYIHHPSGERVSLNQITNNSSNNNRSD